MEENKFSLKHSFLRKEEINISSTVSVPTGSTTEEIIDTQSGKSKCESDSVWINLRLSVA